MNGAVARRMHFQMFSGISRMAARRPGELYYIGGSDVLPAPLDPEREARQWPGFPGKKRRRRGRN